MLPQGGTIQLGDQTRDDELTEHEYLQGEQSGEEEELRERGEGEEARLTELAVPPPVDGTETEHDGVGEEERLEEENLTEKSAKGEGDEEFGGEMGYLSELAAPAPVEQEPSQNRRRRGMRRHDAHPSGGSPLSGEQHEDSTPSSGESGEQRSKESPACEVPHVSRFATELYIVSYLILFSILGTLARLGLQALTFYPGAPVVTGVLWANMSGSLFLGFLSTDRKLFREEWGLASASHTHINDQDEDAVAKAQKRHGKVKKTIPLFIGLATGFCGSFTSFSSFILDVFLALSNDLPSPISHPSEAQSSPVSTMSTVSRNGGFSFMALVAVILLTVFLCLGGLQFGAHLALALEPITPTVPFYFVRKILDPFVVVLAWGCWLGAIIMAIWPPDRNRPRPEVWRGRAVYALVFAPPGCLLRFYASLHLNGRIPAFPLGTFFVNMFGTIIESMCYDLQHASSIAALPSGNVVGCQMLQGVIDGFCGCTTTVSTWVAELKGLRRKHAYFYGLVSVGVGLSFMTVITGTLRWKVGFAMPACGS